MSSCRGGSCARRSDKTDGPSVETWRQDQLYAAAPCSQLNGRHPRPVNAYSGTADGTCSGEGRHLPAPSRAVLPSPPTLAAVSLSLRHLWHWLEARFRAPPAEPSRLILGSTGSGKSVAELVDLVRLAGRR